MIVGCSASSAQSDPPFSVDEKINGISFVATPSLVDSSVVQPVVEVGANWVTIMPFGFLKSLESADVVFNVEGGQWWGEKSEGARITGKFFQQSGMKVMLKPQLWVSHGEYTGYIKMTSEEDWEALEDSYSNFILTFARDAEAEGFELFCIGTELEAFVDARPEYWEELIVEIRKVYSGELTYAGNWDAYKRFPLWSALDYVGVDAYFPLSVEETPSLEQLEGGWKEWENELRSFSNTLSKPILFTEYGYRSVHHTAKEPWQSGNWEQAHNFEAQNNALQAMYNSVWDEDWFAGGFLWKWFHPHEKQGKRSKTGFTPQNKPAEEVVREWYLKYKKIESEK